MRLLIVILIAFVLYRLFKKYIGAGSVRRSADDGSEVDEMVQDPSCMTYIPKRTAYRKTVGGREHFFCSRECAERFMRDAGG